MAGFFPDEQTTDQKLDLILKEITKMALDLTALTAQVAATASAEQSAITLINGLATEISSLASQLAAGTADPTAVAALSAQLQTSSAALAAAVAAVPPPPPVTPPTSTTTPVAPAKKKP